MISKTSYILTFDWLNELNDLHHKAFATSASLNKTAFTFHLLDTLYALTSAK